MKKILNKWQFVFIWGNSWAYRNSRTFVFGFFKLISLPKEGEYIKKENYKGFLIDKQWKPFEIEITF